jgi:hypothetical protein
VTALARGDTMVAMCRLGVLLLASLAGCHLLLPLSVSRDTSGSRDVGSDHRGEASSVDGRNTLPDLRRTDLALCPGWCPEASPRPAVNLNGVWVAADGSEAFAVGDGGTVLWRAPAGGWTEISPVGLAGVTLKGVSGLGGTVWVVGSDLGAGASTNVVWTRAPGGDWTDLGFPTSDSLLEFGLTRIVATGAGEAAMIAVDAAGNTFFLQYRNGWQPLVDGDGRMTWYSFHGTDLTTVRVGGQHEEYVSGDDGTRLSRAAGAGDFVWNQVPDGNHPAETITYSTIFADGSFWCALGTQTNPGPASPVGYCCAHTFGTPDHVPCTAFPPLVQDLGSLWAHPSAGWFAVGAKGALLTFKVDWPGTMTPNVHQPYPAPAALTSETLNSVSGAVRPDGSLLVIAVGNNGTILVHQPPR